MILNWGIIKYWQQIVEIPILGKHIFDHKFEHQSTENTSYTIRDLEGALFKAYYQVLQVIKLP